jgi:hypothetical protein
MTTAEDRSSDKRLLVAFGGLMAVEIFLGALADAGAIGLNWWLFLSVAAVLVTAVVSAMSQRRVRG